MSSGREFKKNPNWKIALASDWYLPRWGGIELGLHKLAKRLQAKGHEVHIITSIPGPDQHDGIKVHRLATRRFPKYHFALSPKIFSQMRRIFQREKFDLVHSHGSSVPPVAVGSVMIAQDMGLPCVCTFRSLVGNYQFILKIFDLFLKWTDYPVIYSANSNLVANQLRRWMGPNKVDVLYNGLDPAKWLLPREDAEGEDVRIVSTMRVTRRKRPVEFIKMISQVRAQLPRNSKFKVTIIGDGPARKKVLGLAMQLGLEDVVSVTGFLKKEEVKEFLARSDIYVQPTIVEAFGNAALEARAAGLPVIAHEQGGIKEFITDGLEGFITPNDGAMVERMVELITNRELRQKIIDHNRANPPLINWENVLEAHHRIYRKAIRLVQTQTIPHTLPTVVPEESTYP